MKIALASAKFINNDISYNLSQIKKYALLSKERNADLVCFGESFLQGFDCLCWNYEKDKEVALELSSPVILSLCQFSQAIGIDLMFGLIERESDRLYSSCVLISNGKILHNYRRISHGWKEYSITDFHYCEGESPKPFLYRGKQCLIGLCGDLWEFPQQFELGEDVLFWPVYVNFSLSDWKTTYLSEYIDHSKQFSCDVLMINSVSENPDAFGGCFHLNNGVAKNSLDFGQEGLLIVELP